MKRKLFLTLVMTFVFALALAFAVSAGSVHNASTVNYDETVTLDDGTVCNLFDEDGNALIWFKNAGVLQSIRADDTEAGDDGNYVSYVLPSAGYTSFFANVNIHIGSTKIEIKDIVVFNIMDDDINAYYTNKGEYKEGNEPFTALIETFNKDNKNKNGTMALEYAYLRLDTTSLGQKAFARCTKLKYVNLDKLTQLTNIGSISSEYGGTFNYGEVFIDCTSLFEGQILDLSKTSLTRMAAGNASGGNFSGVPMIGVKFPVNGSNITIGKASFNGCSYLKTIWMGSNIAEISREVFYATSLETVFFVGTEEELNTVIPKITTNYNQDFLDIATQNKISYNDYLALADKSGKHFVVDYTLCAYNDGVHGEITSSGACVGVCSVCDAIVANHNDDTNLSVSIIYSDYSKEGEKITTCQNDGCTYNVTEETPALFTCLGYSVGPDGYSLKAGYMVNIDAMTEFKTFHPSFSFGVVIANANTVKAEESFFVNEVINSSAKGIMVRVDDLQYSILNVDISNFNASMADTLELVVGIYTNDGEGNIAVAQHVNIEAYTTIKTYGDMKLNAITFNQVRKAHDMDALVPTPALVGDEE